MLGGTSESPGSEMEEGCDPPFDDLDVHGEMGRPEWVGDPPEMDFGVVDDGDGVKDSPDSPENLEDRGWRVEVDWSAGQKGSCASASLATTTTVSPFGPVGYAMGRSRPTPRLGTDAGSAMPQGLNVGRGRGRPNGSSPSLPGYVKF